MESIVQKIIDAGFSASTLQKYQYDAIDKHLGGEIDITDATNPFVLSLEMGTQLAVASMLRTELALGKIYKSLADNWDDLYRHMSDTDYLNLFCGFSSGKFNLFLSKDEIYAKAVRVGETGVRKLIIPKYSKVSISGHTFMLMYPIEIRVMSHGGLQIVHDTTVESNFYTLESNIIEWQEGVFNEIRMINLPLVLPQVDRLVYHDTLNRSTGFRKTYYLKSQFYWCEVFGVKADGTTVPFHTTHSEEIYDKRKFTALLRYSESALRVEIPRVYFTQVDLPNQIKVVIYTSNGAITMNMDEYPSNSFTLEYGEDYTDVGDSIYSAPLETWATMGIAGDGMVNGGSNGVSLERARQMVIDNSTNISLPITYSQLQSKLELKGFSVITSIDNLMQRVYLATRHLPPVVGSEFTSGASCMIATLQTDMASLAEMKSVRDNGLRLTITPDTLYKSTNGILTIVDEIFNPKYMGLPNDAIATLVNANDYMYSPFHYVLDANDNSFNCRAYHLDNAQIVSRQFILENDTTQLSVSSRSLDFRRRGNHYVLTIQTATGEEYKDIPTDKLFAQLSFRPDGENRNTFMNGTMISVTEDGDAVWEFILETNLDIDERDFLQLKNFSTFAEQVKNFSATLTQEFDLIYGVTDYTIFGLQISDIDLRLGRHLLEDNVIGIVQERVTLKFGENLEDLWSNGRTVLSSIKYQIHEEDVPYVTEHHQYEIDPATGKPKVWVEDGELKYNIIKPAGTPLEDEFGNVIYRWRAGDLVVDSSGAPIIEEPRLTQRQVDLFMVDGVYYFSTTLADQTYKETIAKTVIDFLGVDLASVKPTLHEKTKLAFYPRKSLGQNKVRIKSDIVTEIPAGLSFRVTYYMNHLNYRDLELRNSIVSATKRIINEALKLETVSTSGIMEMLRQEMFGDIVSVEMEDMGLKSDITTFTAYDESTRCSVRRNLKVLSNGTLGIEEDITVDFLRHKE